MSPEAQRIAIAEACGFKLMAPRNHPALFSLPNNWMPGLPPDYLNDLNACHEMEGFLPSYAITGGKYQGILATLTNNPTSATAAQRCEAFLKTLKLWNSYA